MSDNPDDRYPDVPLKMYQVTFGMKKRRGNKHLFTIAIPATSPEAAARAVHSFCWGINEATAHLYVDGGYGQTISVSEVEHVRVFADAVND